MERILCTGVQRNGRTGRYRCDKIWIIGNEKGSGRKRNSFENRFLSEPSFMQIS